MARSPQLEKQWALLDHQDYQSAVDETQALLGRLRGADQRDAYRLLAWARYHLHEFSQASFWFGRACQGSEDANDWLNLALAQVRDGDIAAAELSFEQVRLCQQVARFAQRPGFYLQLCWYASALCDARQPARVAPLLDELAEACRRLGSSDTTLLYCSGMPFLSSVLALAVRHFGQQGQRAEGAAWMQKLAAALDEGGRRRVQRAIEELRGEGEQPEA